MMVLDGSAGTILLHPTPGSLAAARRAVAAFARDRQRLSRLRRLPAVTLDGETVDLHANLELPVELPMVAQSGATGIGLLRSEFLFMNRDTVPNEDEQADTYRTVVETMQGDPVTIRVLDWGGEKEIEALTAAGVVPDLVDANPALGLRGIRLLLRQPALFEAQLAAILRAAAAGPVRVLLPMVTNVAEVRSARSIYGRVAEALREQARRCRIRCRRSGSWSRRRAPRCRPTRWRPRPSSSRSAPTICACMRWPWTAAKLRWPNFTIRCTRRCCG